MAGAPGCNSRWLRLPTWEVLHLLLHFRHGGEEQLPVDAFRAFQLAGVAEGADVLANEHAMRVHGLEVPMHMPELHPAVQAGEAEAPDAENRARGTFRATRVA